MIYIDAKAFINTRTVSHVIFRNKTAVGYLEFEIRRVAGRRIIRDPQGDLIVRQVEIEAFNTAILYNGKVNSAKSTELDRDLNHRLIGINRNVVFKLSRNRIAIVCVWDVVEGRS